MNLSQILNPPGGSSVPEEGPVPSRRQQRTSPSPCSSAVPSTSILRFDAPFHANSSNTTTLSAKDKSSNAPLSSILSGEVGHLSTLGITAVPSGPSRKHASSVSVCQLHDSTTAPGTAKSNGLLPGQKIKPNETNDGYSTSTFRANVRVNPAKEKSTLVITQSSLSTNNATAGVTSSGALLGPNPADTFALTANTAKKKMRQQAGDAASFQDSFQTGPIEPKKKASKKSGVSTNGADSEQQQQQRLEIRFVMSDKESQEKKHAKHEQPSAPQAPLDTQEDDALDQGVPESSPTPDFERNSDGKFRCSWPRCGKEFTVASRLTTHYRIHSGKPPYLCGYKGCEKAFHTSSSLSHHRVVHTDQGLRPYICRHNRCGATYTQLARLITHQRTTHSGMILFIPQETSSSSPSSSATVSATSSPAQQTSHSTLVPSSHSQEVSPAASPVESQEHGLHDPADRSPLSLSHGSNGHHRSLSSQQRDPSNGYPVEQAPAPGKGSSLSSSRPALSNGKRTVRSGHVALNEDQGTSPENLERGSRMDRTYQDNLTDNREEEEEEESDEMRLKKEAALTMTSLRAMVENPQGQGRSHVQERYAGYPGSTLQESHYGSHPRHDMNGYYPERYPTHEPSQPAHPPRSGLPMYSAPPSSLPGPNSNENWKYGPSVSISEFHTSSGVSRTGHEPQQEALPPHQRHQYYEHHTSTHKQQQQQHHQHHHPHHPHQRSSMEAHHPYP
ncbi:hypothetical protein EMPS_09706 [Entomortierella parvispora]|uniref:C2H2-type domain-containing protein n=1 Tax=Entomortierella parvispora TaxID=205924 RepID=A0A9P3M0M2_9FUNG|nr:hypothetical protein EMPS_09706 [Entomortierella parvispora]